MYYVYLFLIPMHDKVDWVLHACYNWVRTYLKSNTKYVKYSLWTVYSTFFNLMQFNNFKKKQVLKSK